MEQTLTHYLRALRQAGSGVSTTEAIDAARAVEVVGYGDRNVLKAALGVVLAKSAEEKALHEQMFDLFFRREPAGGLPSTASGQGSDPEEAGGEGESPEGQGLAELAASGDAGRISMALERAAARAGVDQIRFASQASFYSRRMLEEMGVGELEARLLEALKQKTPEGEAEAGALMAARTEIQRQARALVDGRFEVFGRAATEAFMNEVMTERAIGQLGRGDMARMKLIVARMAKRLAVRHSRRRRVRNRGKLDVRRTLRANAGYDGVPFDVIWKMKRRDRPKIVAVCDVSGSVAQYVRFLLLLLYTLKEKVTDLETFAFSSHLMDVSRPLETLDFETAMGRILDEVGTGNTDYGQAFAQLRREHMAVIDRRTTLLVLGDGRSNYGDPRLDLFQEAAAQAKRVVWLCPEPPGSWGTGDSCILQYRPFCTRLTYCSTPAELERVLDEVLSAYD